MEVGSFYIFRMDIVENDFNVVQDNTSYLTVSEVKEDVYDSSLTVIAEEFNYMEIFGND